MATYTEIRDLFSEDALRNRVTTAVVKAAYDLSQSTPSANDKAWIASVLSDPQSEGRKAFYMVLAANLGASVAAIQSASDSAIQTNVDDVITILVDALAGV